jgi:uncharacterized repeat protein (TIGR03803 family)
MRLLSASIRLVTAFIIVGFSMSLARSQTVEYQVLGNFGATRSDGTDPLGGVTIDSGGNIYGTCSATGAGGGGMVWEIDKSGNYHDLHDFGHGMDGRAPQDSVTIDAAGNLYGTCSEGGADQRGMVWEINKSDNYDDLHDFGAGTDGSSPTGVSIDSAGSLYGTTFYGGTHGDGMVWEIDSSGIYHNLHNFGTGTDGSYPAAGVTIDSTGDLYGTCLGGGSNNAGMVWEIEQSGNYRDVHDFGVGTDGTGPLGGVTIDSSGNMYGTCASGGSAKHGMLWQIDQSSNYHDLHDFGTGTDGMYPEGNVTIDSAGDLYGTCYDGGAEDGGMVWEIDKSAIYHDLHDFGAGKDGYYPQVGVTLDAAGDVFGTCYNGGTNGGGAVWDIAVTGPTLSGLSIPQSALGGSTVSGSVSLATAGTLPNFRTVQITSDNSAISTTSVMVPVGATEASFALKCGPVTSMTTVHVTASKAGVTQTSTIVLYPGLDSLALSPASVFPGEPCDGTLSLNLPAPAGGWVVHLSSNDSKVGVPSSVTVPAGNSSASFPVTVPSASLGETAQISASDADVTLTQNLNVMALYTSGISLSPSLVYAGSTSTGTVTLNTATPSGFTVKLASQYPALVGIPSTLTIPANASSATFQITTKAAANGGTYAAWINASDVAASKQATITVQSAHVIQLSLNPTTVAGGSGVTGHLTLNVPAPSGGLLVNLASQYPNLVGVPASVTIPAGLTSATFAISTMPTSGTYACVIKSTDPVGSQTATLTVVSP